MKLPRRKFLHLAAGAAALVSRVARAQTYPTQPLRWIVGFPPGGGADTMARVMGRWLSERLGQSVIIENKPGGGTNIAAQAVVNSPPDGHTLLFLTAANTINTTLFETLPFNLLRDIAPVAGLIRVPLVMVVNPSVPARTVTEFVSYAKVNPGKLNMASFGTGTGSHLAGELFKVMTGVNMVHVPYRGSAPALTDLISGRVQVMFDGATASLPHIRSGALRALAVATVTRLDMLPDVPTVGEIVPGYEASGWNGVGVPIGTPREIILRLNSEINSGLENPTIRAQLHEMVAPPIIFTPAEFGAFMADETEKWAKAVKFSGAKPD